jgi:CheY-like chemotaxis protein
MQMPKMDGEQTLKAIRHEPSICDVPIIILTSVGMRGDAARLESLGGSGYLVKPIKQSQLLDTIITVLSQQKGKAKDKPSPIVTQHTIAEQKSRNIRILVAEDNPMNQKLAVTLLRRASYTVEAVENGRLAVQALKRKAYDLVFMDVQMPEMDGFEATRAIREMEDERKHTPIIAMTAHAMKGDRERCLQAGMDDYISKPIKPQAMFDNIEKWGQLSKLKKTPIPRKISEKHNHTKDAPLDLQDALTRFNGDQKFLREMVEDFLRSAPKQLEKLKQGIRSRDNKKIETEAHSLKGAAGNLSAKRISNLALKLELSGRTGDLTDAEETLDNLITEITLLHEYFNQAVNKQTAGKA